MDFCPAFGRLGVEWIRFYSFFSPSSIRICFDKDASNCQRRRPFKLFFATDTHRMTQTRELSFFIQPLVLTWFCQITSFSSLLFFHREAANTFSSVCLCVRLWLNFVFHLYTIRSYLRSMRGKDYFRLRRDTFRPKVVLSWLSC